MSIIVAIIIALLFCGDVQAQTNAGVDPAIMKKHHEMLYPVVRIRTGKAIGSGSIIYSQRDSAGNVNTYVMTNHHVIAELIMVQRAWDPAIQRDRKREFVSPAEVQFFEYDDYSRIVSTRTVMARPVAYSTSEKGGEDWALLKVDYLPEPLKHIVHLYPKDEETRIAIGDEVWACGATLGVEPFMTRGEIALRPVEIDDYEYCMATTPTSFGNSGGATFRHSAIRDRYELIGIPSRISVLWGSTPIDHMGYFIPIWRIYNLLDRHCYQFIYDLAYTIEQCDKMRSDLQKPKPEENPEP